MVISLVPSIAGSLLIGQAANHERKDLAFARREQCVMPLQFGKLRSFLTRLAIEGDGCVNCLEQFLLAKRFRQELKLPRLSLRVRTRGHRRDR